MDLAAVAQEEAVVVEVSNYWLDKKKTTQIQELKDKIDSLTAENRALSSKLLYKQIQTRHLVATIESLVSEVTSLKKDR